MSTLITLVTGLLIGSASGIGGSIVGSWMTGKAQLATLKAQINADKERSRILDKRQLYVSFVTKASESVSAIIIYRNHVDQDEAKKELERTTVNLINIGNEILLFGPGKVANVTDELTEYLVDCTTSLRENATYKYNSSKAEQLTKKVHDAIREDIGVYYP